MSLRSLCGVSVYGNLLLVLLLVGSCGAVHAQGYALGANGAPTTGDYNSASYGFSGIIAPILKTLLPWCLGCLAVWCSPYIVKKLLYRFRDGAGFKEQFKGDFQLYVSNTKKAAQAERDAADAKKLRAERRVERVKLDAARHRYALSAAKNGWDTDEDRSFFRTKGDFNSWLVSEYGSSKSSSRDSYDREDFEEWQRKR